MTRRRFAFWFGLILFWFGRRLHAKTIDALAAKLMQSTEGSEEPFWRVNANKEWQWFELVSRVNGRWDRRYTRPVHRKTRKLYSRKKMDFLSDEEVPQAVRDWNASLWKKLAQGRVEPCKLGEGQPPSEWLRSLEANELKVWLRTIQLPEVGVEQMSFWTHLTRDHAFEPKRIEGLTEAEQAKLHAAAHYGY